MLKYFYILLLNTLLYAHSHPSYKPCQQLISIYKTPTVNCQYVFLGEHDFNISNDMSFFICFYQLDGMPTGSTLPPKTSNQICEYYITYKTIIFNYEDDSYSHCNIHPCYKPINQNGALPIE